MQELGLEFENSKAFASTLDATDPLAHFRERFYMPRQPNGEEVIYFTGNSLGLQPKTTREYVDQELKDWETLGVEGHLHAQHPWLPYHEFLTEQMARVVGAKPIETVVMNSLTVNLHLLMVSFYRPAGERYKIVIEKGAFPSDQYAIQSQILFHAKRSEPPALAGGFFLIELAPRSGETTLRTEDIVEAIEREGDSIALVLLGGVNYYTGQAFDMQTITDAGHRAGALVGFDLAHAAGNLELRLHDCDADAILIKVVPAGPVCHTGSDTCFNETNENEDFLFELEKVIRDRKTNPSAESYTSKLFNRGLNKIAQKFGEEAVELIIEAKDNDVDLFKAEAADVLYHFLVLLRAKNVELRDVFTTLEDRRANKG